MALSLRRNTTNEYVGLDVDGPYLAAAELANGQLRRACSRDLEPGVVEDGEVRDVDGLSDVLKDFFKSESLPRRVRLGVANQQIVVRHIEMPKIDDKGERDAAVRFQTAEAVAMPLEDAVVDYQVVGETQSADGHPRSRVLVVAARKAMVLRLIEAVRGAGLKPDGIDLSAFAVLRTLAERQSEDGHARVYCHLGGVANLAVARGSTCLFTRPLATRWEEDGGGLEALTEEMRLSIDHYRAQAEAPLVEQLVVSGPGARDEGLVREMGDFLRLQASVPSPLGRVENGLPASEDPYRHTVSVGLAMESA
jgi:type IV pilus assembly protein PilM